MNLYGNQEDVKAFAGSLYGMNPKTIVTYAAGEDIGFGLGVYANKNGIVKSSMAEGHTFVGVAVFHQCEAGKYLEKDAVAVMNDGYIWVKVSNDQHGKRGDSAYVTNAGLFTTNSSSAELVGTFESDEKDGIALLHIYN